MFKPLLRTLPTLSGNVMLAAHVNDVVRTDITDKYESYIKIASLMPLQNNLYNSNIKCNLLQGKFEFELKKYYEVYHDVFYNMNFSFDKTDYQMLDKYTRWEQQQRDKNNEFGCKRISHGITNFQCCFFAPFYIDDVNDLPDTFEIELIFNETITKTLEIHINNGNVQKNYLRKYLHNYIEKIDDNVIKCLPDSYQAIYYGIDLKNGGLNNVVDNLIGAIYANQMTQNNFDYTICDGFKRNDLMMSQIIPLAFVFNIDDVLTKREKLYHHNAPVTVRGWYKKSGIKLNFYDFSIDYENFTLPKISSWNLMDVDFPSLHESKYYKYKYTNKLSPLYTRWKLKYSSDERPYITNASWAFSYISYAQNYQYGDFPNIYSEKPLLEINNGNAIINNTKEDYVKSVKNNTNTWFTTLNSINEAFNDETLWENVSNDEVYYKGILYNFTGYLNKSRDLNADADNHIDKFGVFAIPHGQEITQGETYYAKYSLTYATTDTLKNCLVTGDRTNAPWDKQIFSYMDAADTNAWEFMNDVLFSRSSTGNYRQMFEYSAYNICYTILTDKYNDVIQTLEEKFNEKNSKNQNLEISDSSDDTAENNKNISLATSNYVFTAEELLPFTYTDSLLTPDATTGQKYLSISNSIFYNVNANSDIPKNNFYPADDLHISFINSSDTDHWLNTEIKNTSVKYYDYMLRHDMITKDGYELLGDEKDSLVNTDKIYSFVPYFNSDEHANVNYVIPSVLNKLNLKSPIAILNQNAEETANYQAHNKEIFIDTYNIDNFNKFLHDTYYKNDDISNIIEKDNKVYAFSKVPSLEYLYKYYSELWKTNDVTNNGPDWTQTDNTPAQEALNYIYCRINPTLYCNSNEQEVQLMYEFKSVKNRFESEDDWGKTLNDEEKITYNQFLSFLTETEDGFVFKNGNIVENINIYVYKPFYALTKDGYNTIKNIYNQYGVVEPLYLYTIEDEIKEIQTFKYCKDLNELSGKIILPYNCSLQPLFYNLYKFNSTEEMLLLFNSNLIHEYQVGDDKYMVYDEYDSEAFCEIKSDISDDNIPRYKRVDTMSLMFEHSDYPEFDKFNYNKDNNLYTYYNTLDDKVYAFYCLDVAYTPSKYSFNSLSSDVISYINGKPISTQNFNLLVPYFKKSIFSKFVNNTNTIVLPHTLSISAKYFPYIYDDGNTLDSIKYKQLSYVPTDKGMDYEFQNQVMYDIKFIKDSKKTVSFNRYFDRITPYITKVNSFDSGSLLFKTFKSTVRHNNIKNTKINIYEYSPITFAYDTLDSDEYLFAQFKEYEYKHFNDNLIWNLDTSFDIKLPDKYIYNELLELETKEKTIEVFKKYILTHKSDKYDDDIILFLFNKYNVNYVSEQIAKTVKNERLYTLTYKFNLI